MLVSFVRTPKWTDTTPPPTRKGDQKASEKVDLRSWRIYCGHTRQPNCKWLQDSCDNSFVDDEEKKGGKPQVLEHIFIGVVLACFYTDLGV